MNRTGEKIGWIAGWIGGFLWVLGFGIYWTAAGKTIEGLLAAAIFILSIFSIVFLSPWRNPKKKYWKLMLPNYILLLFSIALVIGVLSGFKNLAEIRYGIWIIPCLIPIIVLGNKTWE